MSDRSVSVLLKANVSSFIAGIEQAKLKTKDFANDAEKSATKHKESWDMIGKASMVTGGVILAGVGMAVKSFMDFDQSMSRAQAGTMATGAELAALRTAAIDAGAATQFSATEAADAITAMGKAGVSTKDILGGGLNGALSLAAAGELDVASASEIAATAMNQFGLQGKDIPHVADLLAAGAGKAMGSVEDLAGALKYVGPVAKGLGISIEQTTGTLSMFAQAGIVGEQAGTSMRGMLTALTSPSKIAKGAMDDLGMTMYDARGKFVGLDGIAGQLHDKLGPLDEATRNQALGQIFGNEQITAARVLYEGGAPAVQEWTNKVNDSGFAAKQAAMLTANLKGDIERLGGSLSSVLIESGSGANTMLRTMTQEVQGVVDRYGALPVPIQQGALALGAVTGAALLTGGALVTFVPKAIAANAALVNMGRSGAVAATAIKGLGIASAVALVGLPILDAAASKVSGTLGQLAPGADAAGKAMTQLANGGKASGDSADLINRHFGDLSNTINNVFNPALGHKVSAFFSQISPGNLTGFETSETSQSIEFFKTLDSGLASMVASGNGPKAAELLKRVTDEANKQGYSVKTVTAALPGYSAAVGASGTAAAAAASGTSTLTGAQQAMKTATDASKKALDDEVASMQSAGLVVLSTRDARRQMIEAINGGSEAVKKNGQTLDINTQKGRDNQVALDGVAGKALGLADSIYKETGSEEAMRASLVTSRASLVTSAIHFGMTKDQANKYADSVLKIPAAASTTVNANTAPASAKLAALQRQLDAATADQTVNIRYYVTTSGKAPALGGSAKSVFNVGTNAAGTDNWRGGPTWVGENGPEILSPPPHSQIIPTHKTAAYLAAPSTPRYLSAPAWSGPAAAAPAATGTDGNVFNITEVSDSVGTAHAVVRRISMLGKV
jgi:TP901 family phage tail tape measure protein